MEHASEHGAELYKASRTTASRDQGPFRTNFNFPGRNRPGHDDHGYGPLSTVVESFMDPGTLIPMHQHRNEEIVSWVPAGVMRHDDGEGNRLVTDAEHLLVMNAGSGFWHSEETFADDPPLRMLQIFVRPHELELEPGIQHEPLPEPVANEWRRVFAPAGADHPLTVRNAASCDDLRLDAGESVALSRGEEASAPDVTARETTDDRDWDVYFYVFEGEVTAAGRTFGRAESGLWVGGATPTLTATEDAVVVTFRLDPDAPITRQGTIGR
ncbi:pirin family protein [Halorubrum sp. AD140]|uniref:pirin family protein n=1 Tax=Halorubrum sp. AD140 TaxID=3050073 RepID=UPI002ACC9735|nr:pirin family protein [Halorubrum sp. AD140]MDZ5812190.1 pirin family protein [Halorubrum sp. AD140]